MIKFLSILMLLLIAIPIGAQQDKESGKLQRFIELLDIPALVRDSEQICLSQYTKTGPNELAEENPDYFGGIKPGSDYWPRIEAAWQRYVETACQISIDDWIDAYTTAFSEHFDEDLIDEALRLYSTDRGRRILKAQLNARPIILEHMQSKNNAKWMQANAIYTEEMDQIFDEFQGKRHWFKQLMYCFFGDEHFLTKTLEHNTTEK
jgi:hypothetical protein